MIIIQAVEFPSTGVRRLFLFGCTPTRAGSSPRPTGSWHGIGLQGSLPIRRWSQRPRNRAVGVGLVLPATRLAERLPLGLLG